MVKLEENFRMFRTIFFKQMFDVCVCKTHKQMLYLNLNSEFLTIYTEFFNSGECLQPLIQPRISNQYGQRTSLLMLKFSSDNKQILACLIYNTGNTLRS